MWKLFWGFVVLALAAAVWGAVLTVTHYNRSGWADVGRSLLALAVTATVGGVAMVAVKVVERRRDDAAAWREMLRDIVEVDQALETARQLIYAHRTAKTYSEQYARILATRLTLRRIWFDPLVANDRQSIRKELELMIDYVDALGAEYERGYLVVGLQQRIDEEDLRRRIVQVVNHGDSPLPTTGPHDLSYEPTRAWKMLSDPGRFPELVRLLDSEAFEKSTFLASYRRAKMMLEKRSGIKARRDITPPAVMTTAVTAAPRSSRP